jgi:hypothetical protein
MKKYPDRNLLETTLPEHQFELNDVETKVCNMLLSSLKVKNTIIHYYYF